MYGDGVWKRQRENGDLGMLKIRLDVNRNKSHDGLTCWIPKVKKKMEFFHTC